MFGNANNMNMVKTVTADGKVADSEKGKYAYVPVPSKTYIKWGHYDRLKTIISSGLFYPIWITGLSGNGKTEMVMQVCAELGRKIVRLNFTQETDESDIIGGLRLINGSTEYQEGPVISAMREGAILLLDEIDAANENKILVLQSVLEGKGVLIKSTGEYVQPAKGFNVIATSNTKGLGDDTGKFLGVNMMNGAFLDRFVGTIEQSYPPTDTEKAILAYCVEEFVDTSKLTKEESEKMVGFIKPLLLWAAQSRENFYQGNSSEVITTRTLINIVRGFYALKFSKMECITLACSRFAQHEKEALIQAYKAFDKDYDIDSPSKSNQTKSVNSI